MLNVTEFLKVAVPPTNLDPAWLEGAESAVKYLVRNGHSDEIILFSNVGQTYINAVLAPLINLSSEAVEQLEHANIDPSGQWALGHVSGGGEPDRMYLSDPVDSRCMRSAIYVAIVLQVPACLLPPHPH